MFRRTDTDIAPWITIKSNDKKRARISAMRHFLSTVDYDGKDQPRWGDHKATLQSVVTPEWAAFMAVNEKWLSQLDFAEFIETWNHVVTDPDSAEIVEIAMNLQGSSSGTFASKINRHNGAVTLNYQEDINTSGQVRVPTTIGLYIAPFEHSSFQTVAVSLRFRINEGSPKFQLVIQNAERIEQEALRKTFAEVGSKADSPVLVAP